jgi:hypothetical protein
VLCDISLQICVFCNLDEGKKLHELESLIDEANVEGIVVKAEEPLLP